MRRSLVALSVVLVAALGAWTATALGQAGPPVPPAPVPTLPVPPVPPPPPPPTPPVTVTTPPVPVPPVPSVTPPRTSVPAVSGATSTSAGSPAASAAASAAGAIPGVQSFSPLVGSTSTGGSSSSGGSSSAADGPAAEQQSLAQRRSTAARRVRGTRNVRPVPARFENRGPNRRSTVLVFWLDRPGRVVFTVLDVSAGCRALGSFAYRGRAGVNRVRYRGRVDGKPLAAGRYTLVPRVYRNGRATQLERVTIQILRPGAKVPLWRRTTLVPGECRGNRLAGVYDSATFGSRFAGSTSAFARGGSSGDGAASGGGRTGGVKGAEKSNPAEDEPVPIEEDPGDDVDEGIALPAPFSNGGDGPPPLVAAAVLTGLGLAIMMLIVLLVRYVRGSWNP